jgi:perosamine synthetase
MIPIYKPYLNKNCLAYAHEALDSAWVSSHGKYLSLVQEKLQEILNVKYVLPLNNGTSATHLVAKILKNKTNIKKIIVPNNVYVAAWNSFLFDKEYQLISIDADIDTWNFDLKKLHLSICDHPDAAVLIVHNIGNILNVEELKRKYPNTTFVEDNCEGFLGKYENKYSGTSSLVSSISFFGNKNITSGEGGAIVTNDEESYLFAKCIHGQGQSNTRFIHHNLGYNYRMTNIQAAILYGQIYFINQILEMKEKIFENYKFSIKDRDDVFFQKIENNTNHSNWMFGVRVLNNKNYSFAENFFNKNKIEIRPMFYPITNHNHIKNNPNVIIDKCVNARLLNKQCFILPSFPEMSNDEQKHVINTLLSFLKEIK